MTDAARLPYLTTRVIWDDDRPEMEAHADQRDMRRAQVGLSIDPERDPLGFARGCAWACLQRTGQIDGLGWKEFDASVSFVLPLDDDAEPTGADPTRTDTGE